MRHLSWILAILLVATSANAAGIPDPLRNKSVVLSWTDEQVASFHEGETHRDRVSSDITVYISSAGRLFSRHVRQTSETEGTQYRTLGRPVM
jgi:hypothetical protein